MKYALIALVLIGLFWACSGASAGEQPDGHLIYKMYCVSCHGMQGNMGGNGAFDISRSALSVEQRVEVITGGRNTMTSFGFKLTPEQIRAVAEYTMELKANQ